MSGGLQWGSGQGRITNGHKETSGGDGYTYLDYCNVFTGGCPLCQNLSKQMF